MVILIKNILNILWENPTGCAQRILGGDERVYKVWSPNLLHKGELVILESDLREDKWTEWRVVED
jgi:hypothetical protein